MTTIYKQDRTGGMRYLTVSTEGNIVVKESGTVGTDSPVIHRSPCKAKNVGKANETTPEEQAVLEGRAYLVKKLKKDYYPTEEEAKAADKIMPMLAEHFPDFPMEPPFYAQPKFDGMRLMQVNTEGNTVNITRTGQSLETVPFIDNAAKKIISHLSKASLDGELYVHGEVLEDVMRLCKKHTPKSESELEYHIYDVIDFYSGPEQTFKERFEGGLKAVEAVIKSEGIENVKVAETVLCNTMEEFKAFYDKCIENGYEGAMIRSKDGKYVHTYKSRDLLKYKDHIDDIFTVIDVIPSEKAPKQARLVLHTKDGKEFKAALKMSHKIREEVLANADDYIGKPADIRFFSYTKEGIPRNPRCFAFPIDK